MTANLPSAGGPVAEAANVANEAVFAPHHTTALDGTAIPPDDIAELGLLREFIGFWSGTGFNAIWTPSQIAKTQSDHFLQLAITDEQLEVFEIHGDIPNRGLDQGDILVSGMRYLQRISSNGKALHIENGMWLSAPATTSPQESATVVRMASIPHGTSILAQGTVTSFSGAPQFDQSSLRPFFTSNPNSPVSFTELTSDVEQDLPFRTHDLPTRGITDAMLANPNSALKAGIDGKAIKSTVVVQISTANKLVTGSGTDNTAFLGPNATASLVTATFWIETVAGTDGQPDTKQLQYSQLVLLDFAGISWPHVTVGTLIPVVAG